MSKTKAKKTTRPRGKTARRRAPAKCKHTEFTLGDDGNGWWKRCDDCNELLPLGLSNDDSETVRVEMRAAELADTETSHADHMEASGWGARANPIPDSFMDDPCWLAGWLGSEIYLIGVYDDPDNSNAWPWDPTRPVSSQYEECIAAQAWTCPVESNECEIRRKCTNKCGRLDRSMLAAAEAIDPSDPTLIEVDGPLPSLECLATAYESQRTAEPDCRDEDGPEVERLMDEVTGEPPREPKHCDDYIDDESAPAALRAFLRRARSVAHGHLSTEPFPKLFADHEGRRVRVVMASRFGDVGITSDLTAEYGYRRRVAVEELSNFGDAP